MAETATKGADCGTDAPAREADGIKPGDTVFIVATLVDSLPAGDDLPDRYMVRIAAPFTVGAFVQLLVPLTAVASLGEIPMK